MHSNEIKEILILLNEIFPVPLIRRGDKVIEEFHGHHSITLIEGEVHFDIWVPRADGTAKGMQVRFDSEGEDINRKLLEEEIKPFFDKWIQENPDE